MIFVIVSPEGLAAKRDRGEEGLLQPITARTL